QGDKAVLGILAEMGCAVEEGDGAVTVTGPAEAFDADAGFARAALSGGTFDLNAIPDALPALAVAACFAREPVELSNVPQARAKETDRVSVMAAELTRMGARVEELPDGLRVRPRAGGGGNPRGGGAAGGMGGLGAVGLASATTLLAALVARAARQGPLLPVLLLPLLVPLLVSGTSATRKAIAGLPWVQAQDELLTLIGFAGATLSASVVLFDFVWKE
ncbi:heme exporter protein CcmB, partial [Marivita sp.]|uniref:heme exporter protein CcmB n=1 Tax=Marivita sp. TaxID=2003365 RepID=UPI0025BEA0A7